MKKTILLSVTAFASFALSAGAANVALDNASNAAYSGGGFNSINGGTGFGAWSVSSSGGGGEYVGTTGQGNPSFGIHSQGSGSALASRSLTGGDLSAGQTISMDLGHSNLVNGSVGIDLTDGGATVFTLRFVGGTSNWVINDGGGGGEFGAGQGFSANTSLTFTFTYEGSNDYSYTFGSGSGDNFTATNTISGVDGIKLFTFSQGSGENFGANNLVVTAVPEPSSAALLGLGGLALIMRRRK